MAELAKDNQTISVLHLQGSAYAEHGIFTRRAMATLVLLEGFGVSVDAVFNPLSFLFNSAATVCPRSRRPRATLREAWDARASFAPYLQPMRQTPSPLRLRL